MSPPGPGRARAAAGERRAGGRKNRPGGPAAVFRLHPSPRGCVIPKVKTRLLPLLAAALLAPLVSSLVAAPSAQVTRSDDRVRVELGGQLFTEYLFKGGPRPYFYPVLAADGTRLNRDFPMKKDTPGEELDHPHHRSLWFTHGDVNGLDFWAETNGPKQGTIMNESVKASASGSTATIESRNRWVNAGGVVQCTDETTVRLRAVADGRQIDYEVTLKAPADKPVVFGDTKEGSMAMRVAQWMTPPHTFQKKKTDTQGTIVNAEGIRDGATWSKKSTWVDYQGPKDGKVYGIAMFDHPKNPRHPTWWHVRDYGLFAANPFGKHDFEKEFKNDPQAGALTIPAGGSVTFRWRLYFHMGDEKAAKIAEHYQAYAAGK